MNAPSTAPLVPALSPWLTELVHAVVSLSAVVVGGLITFLVTQASLRRQGERADREEAERHRKQGVRERLLLQRESYSEYLRLMAKHQAKAGTFMEGVGAKLEREKQEENAAQQDALAFYANAVIAFGSEEFATQAADTIQMIAAVKKHPALSLMVTGTIAIEITKQMLSAIEATEKALGLPPAAFIPKAVLPIKEYLKERNRASIRSAVERSGMSREKLEAIFAEIDKQEAAAASGDAESPSDDG